MAAYPKPATGSATAAGSRYDATMPTVKICERPVLFLS